MCCAYVHANDCKANKGIGLGCRPGVSVYLDLHAGQTSRDLDWEHVAPIEFSFSLWAGSKHAAAKSDKW